MTTFTKRHGIYGDLSLSEISLSTKLVLDAAKEYGMTCYAYPHAGLFRLTYQGKSTYIHSQLPSLNSRTAVYCCSNKDVTKALLHANKISTPKGFVIKSTDSKKYIASLYEHLTKPLVVKPSDSSLSKNVHTHITTKKMYLSAVAAVRTYYRDQEQNILVEEMFQGTEYRVLVSRKKIIGVVRRLPAHVIGDGVHTIKELIKIKNNHPWRGGDYELSRLTLGREEKVTLAAQGVTGASIPPAKCVIPLRTSTFHGADTIDCTSHIHPSVRKIILTAMRAIPGLEWAGIDYFSTDITKPQKPGLYTVLEINTSPNLAWQEFPAVGKRRRVALEYLKVVFPW